MQDILTPSIKITKVSESKVNEVDLNNITMGTNFTDHMFQRIQQPWRCITGKRFLKE